MLKRRDVFEIYLLKEKGLSVRQIATQLGIDRESVSKYLNNPKPVLTKRKKASKLEPFYDLIILMLEECSDVSAPVILQKVTAKGFNGEISILRDYLRKVRGGVKSRQAFTRFEAKPGEQMQIDWGHFASIRYGETNRKLYALAVIESYSRMLYVEFTHSQKQEALHQCLLNAFRFIGGTPEEIVVDNMLTAVTEREGRVIRFNESFLDFLRPFSITPRACNIRAPHEKGKIEKSIQYLRRNFWPLRTFTSLEDVQSQVLEWLTKVANVRVHATTGQKPAIRIQDVPLKTLPETLPDVRETMTLLVHKDFSVKFDGNSYTTPPWVIGKQVIVKASITNVTIYYNLKVVAAHQRCWMKKQRIELPCHNELVKKIQKKLWFDQDIAVFASLGPSARDYLNALGQANQPIRKNVEKMLRLKDVYGTSSLLTVIEKALRFKAYGADYIENILYQEMTPKNNHPPVRLKNRKLNNIKLSEPNLAEYDALILKKRSEKDDKQSD